METRAAYVAVGSFVLVLVTGIVVAVLWLAHGQITQATTRYDTYFASVAAGLVEGSPVRISGVQVGHVVGISLNPQSPSRIRVRMEVVAQAPIRSNSVASQEVQPLTGAAAVEITPGDPSVPPLRVKNGEQYPVISSRESAIDQLVQAVPDLLEKLATLTSQLTTLTSPKNSAALADTLTNLQKLTAVAAAHRQDFGNLLADSAQDARALRQTIATMNKAAQRLNGVVAQAGGTLHDVDGMVQENRKPLREFAENGLDELRQLVASTQTLVTAMTRTVDAIQNNPSSLIYGNRREGYRPQ